VEFLAFLGLFLLNAEFAFGAIIDSEVAAKLTMVTITWLGKPTHTGLGSIFLETAKRKRNIVAYLIAVLIVYPLLGLLGVWIILISVLLGALMERIAKNVFGGVSGDMIGATNETARAVTLVFMAGVLML
jgi:adenosylcobinamide-GDP ribazoletransferase